MVAAYYRFEVETSAEFPGRVAISKRKIVGGVIRGRDLVAQLKIAIFFPGVFAVDSRKIMIAKISPLYGINIGRLLYIAQRILFSCKSVSYRYQFQLNSRRVTLQPPPFLFYCFIASVCLRTPQVCQINTINIVYWQVNNIILDLQHQGWLASHSYYASTLYTHKCTITCAITKGLLTDVSVPT